MTSRREMLRIGGQSAAFGLPLLLGLPACSQTMSCEESPTAASDQPLSMQGKERGLLFGTAADRDTLTGDRRYAEHVVTECALLTPENSMKWERLRPTPDRFFFKDSDWLVAFAAGHDLQVHGHTLVWHLQMPSWFDEVVDSRNAERYLADHIETVAGRYAGRVRSWDVVNEAVDPESGRSDGLTLSPWLQHLGAGYIETAFRLAAEADPKARLVYNDNGLEYEGGYFERRRRRLLDLLSDLVAKGTPIHALGVQSHLVGNQAPNFEPFAHFLNEITALGLEIMITELDVSDQGLPADMVERDCLIAETYGRYLDVVLANSKVSSIAVWGLSDRYSWLGEFKQRADNQSVRPLPLDAEMNRKPAWNAISRALAG